MKAADIEISKEGRDARVKKVPAEPCEPESELHSATHIPFRAWCSACVASRAKEDSHWRCACERERYRIVRLRVPRQQNSWGEDCAAPLHGGSCISSAVFAVLTIKVVTGYVIKAVVASVANWSRNDIILKSDGEPSCKRILDDSETRVRHRRSCRTVLLEALAAVGWSSA